MENLNGDSALPKDPSVRVDVNGTSEFKITPITPSIGALIEGISLAKPLSDKDQTKLNEALLKHQALFFRNQPISAAQQYAFASRFGNRGLHVHPIYPNLASEGYEEIMLVSSGKGRPPNTDKWHTDTTFIEAPPQITILASKLVPPPGSGGDTLFASGIAAYEALSKPLQKLLLGLKAEHSFLKSFPEPRRHYGDSRGDPVQIWEEAIRNYPPVVHPVVRTHPESGRKALFVSQDFTTRILDVSKEESDALLNFLFQHTIKPEFTFRWSWQPDDVGFWDNRITQHYAVADYLPHNRIMHRAALVGEKPF